MIGFIYNEYAYNLNAVSIVNFKLGNILANLDLHSTYIPSNEQTLVEKRMTDNFMGIDMNFYLNTDTFAVIKQLENGPSDKAVIKTSDRILFADNYKLYGPKLCADSLYLKLKGEKN